MSITSRHPLYTEFHDDWKLMRDAYRGQRIIKEETTRYLPATPGQEEDGLKVGEKGWSSYKSYLVRARFPDFVASAVEGMVGIMHHKPATIELPPKLEPLMDRATPSGESLQMLLRKINVMQLIEGRLGLLADVKPGQNATALPLIARYRADKIINWDDGKTGDPLAQNLNLVVLDETEHVRETIFTWTQKQKHRVLILGDPLQNEKQGRGTYRMGVFDENSSQFNEAALIEPSIAGRKLDRIPFIIINSRDLVVDPEEPPLLGLGNLSLAVYKTEADYRQALFMQGQDTFVVSGGLEDDEIRIGAGAIVQVDQGGDAKFVGVESSGLTEMREALQNDRREAAEAGGKLIDTRGKEAESGDALRIRVSARTASLQQIAKAGAEGLQDMLRTIATWVGADPQAVKVEPNTDFADDSIEGRTIVDFMTAKTLGAPLSKQSIHRILRERDLTELEFEEEMALIEAEEPELTGTGDGEEETDPQDANRPEPTT